MARTQLNDRQLEILRWIEQGCPDGVQDGTGYKTSAVALQSRRLVQVRRHRDTWSVEITDEGRYYLQHGDYPPRPVKATRTAKPAQPAVLPAMTPKTEPATSPKEPPATAAGQGDTSSTAATPNLGEKLLADLIAAGGRLVVKHGYGPGTPNWPARVSSASRSGMLPAGKLITSQWHPDGLEILLLAVPERLTKPHAVAVAVRDGGRNPFTKTVTARGLRLIHALATEAEQRGYTAKPTQQKHGGYRRTASDDLFPIGDGDFSVAVAFSQQRDRVDHVPTKKELADAQKYSWMKVPRYDHTLSERLTITLNGGAPHRQSQWGDGKKQRLEDKLSEVLQEMELRFETVRARRIAEQEAAALKRQRWEAAMRQATRPLRRGCSCPRARAPDPRLEQGRSGSRIPSPGDRCRGGDSCRTGTRRRTGMACLDRRLCRPPEPVGQLAADA